MRENVFRGPDAMALVWTTRACVVTGPGVLRGAALRGAVVLGELVRGVVERGVEVRGFRFPPVGVFVLPR